eukprot:Sspe_Gene.84805::Locus_55670_Transcript_1_1_Confidence_1.000_Length_451::g.84805::m.84805
MASSEGASPPPVAPSIAKDLTAIYRKDKASLTNMYEKMQAAAVDSIPMSQTEYCKEDRDAVLRCYEYNAADGDVTSCAELVKAYAACSDTVRKKWMEMHVGYVTQKRKREEEKTAADALPELPA